MNKREVEALNFDQRIIFNSEPFDRLNQNMLLKVILSWVIKFERHFRYISSGHENVTNKMKFMTLSLENECAFKTLKHD